MEHDRPSLDDPRQPEIGVGACARRRMVAIDEEQFDGARDSVHRVRGGHHQRLDERGSARAIEVGQERLERPFVGIFPRSDVGIDGVDLLPGLTGAVGEPDRGSSLPRPDLDDRAATGARGRGGMKGAALSFAEPAFYVYGEAGHMVG
ncbi:MAG TPA: hypothetical protein VGD94_17875 [Vicinamibacterales bacterium]